MSGPGKCVRLGGVPCEMSVWRGDVRRFRRPGIVYGAWLGQGRRHTRLGSSRVESRKETMKGRKARLARSYHVANSFDHLNK